MGNCRKFYEPLKAKMIWQDIYTYNTYFWHSKLVWLLSSTPSYQIIACLMFSVQAPLESCQLQVHSDVQVADHQPIPLASVGQLLVWKYQTSHVTAAYGTKYPAPQKQSTAVWHAYTVSVLSVWGSWQSPPANQGERQAMCYGSDAQCQCVQ